MARSKTGGGPSALLMWSLLSAVGAVLCGTLIVGRMLGARVAIEVAAGLVTLYCIMAALLTAVHVTALRDAVRDDEAERGADGPSARRRGERNSD